MKKTIIATSIVLSGIALTFFIFGAEPETVYTPEQVTKANKPPGKRPNDAFYVQRSWPYDSLSTTKHLAAFEYAKQARLTAKDGGVQSAVVWEQAGPTNIPGIITDLAVDTSDVATVYAATGGGGVFKSTNSGVTWTPIFNDQPSLAIGAIALDPNNTDIVYVGTGESNPGFDSFSGTGIYKSIDGGATWSFSGLPNSYRIARIVVDETNSDRIFVAVGGKHFGGGNPDRGVYRSLDGGATWTQQLFVSDTTGCIDVTYDPSTGVVLAAMWERVRFVDIPTRLGGITSGIWRSTDMGDNWTQLTAANGLPAAADTVGRIGLTTANSTGISYAVYATNHGVFMGMYRSSDFGMTWDRTSDADLITGQLNASWQGGWYFGQVRTAPSNPDIVYALGLRIWYSDLSGDSWTTRSSGIHVDQHAMWIHPTNPNFIYSGCDGGVNITTDGGLNWVRRFNQASTQFYGITIDPSNPERLYGGAQDNGTMRTLTGAINDWTRIWGGDGFYVLVDPTDPNRIYVESQFGGLVWTPNNGASWFSGTSGGMNYFGERQAWNTPFVMDPSDPMTIYYGSNKLNKSTDGASTWSLVSPDLTDAPHPRSSFGTISTIAVAPTNSSVIYVGTDDGNVWVTQNDGGIWTQVDGAMPDRWVMRVAVDPNYANIAYVAISGYVSGETMPHIFRTEDFGANWTSISGDLPDAGINDIITLDYDSLKLYIGTDFGVYETANLGATWSPLGTGIPIVQIADLDFHRETGKLVAGTHGQSMFSTTVAVPALTCCDVPGDANNSGSVTIGDATYIIAYIFSGGASPICCAEGDANGTGSINISDATFLIGYIFSGGAAPSCGPGDLGC